MTYLYCILGAGNAPEFSAIEGNLHLLDVPADYATPSSGRGRMYRVAFNDSPGLPFDEVDGPYLPLGMTPGGGHGHAINEGPDPTEEFGGEWKPVNGAAAADVEFMKGLKSVVTGIMDRARAEQRASEPWKALWEASEKGVERLLSDAADRTGETLGALADVIQERFGLKTIPPDLHTLIKALPYAMNEVGDRIKGEQGYRYSSDKKRHAYSLQVIDAIFRARDAETRAEPLPDAGPNP